MKRSIHRLDRIGFVIALALFAAPVHAEGSSGSIINLRIQDIAVQIAGFLVVWWVLARYLWGPVTDMLATRRQDIQDTYDRLEHDRQDMARRQAELEERLTDIEAEARERIAAAIKEAQGMKDEIVADAHTQAQKIIADGHTNVARDRERALLSLREEVASIAVQAASKILDESLDTERQRRLISDFINRVGSA